MERFRRALLEVPDLESGSFNQSTRENLNRFLHNMAGESPIYTDTLSPIILLFEKTIDAASDKILSTDMNRLFGVIKYILLVSHDRQKESRPPAFLISIAADIESNKCLEGINTLDEDAHIPALYAELSTMCCNILDLCTDFVAQGLLNLLCSNWKMAN